MNDLSWTTIVRTVHERADYCCEYCQTCQKVTGQAMHVEHIDPDGGDDLHNLCLSCSNCNLSKARAINAVDPVSNEFAPLFNPRTQQWDEHFEWIEDGLVLRGKTSIARATIARLGMNRERILIARSTWIRAGDHPPTHK